MNARRFPLPPAILFWAVAAGFSLAASPGSAATPSFDCSRATSSAEELVCDDAELAALDVTLAGLYRRATQTVPAEELRTLRAFQRGWIKGRDDCWKADDLRACVADSYRIRITELQIRTGAVLVPDPVSYACDDGTELLAVFYSNTEKPAAVLTRLPDSQVIAYLVPAASGARYEGRNVTFWDKAGEAMVTWNDADFRCRVP